jgi:hypothetical protein
MVTYYDALSYKNLTDLKGETKIFFGACQQYTANGHDSLTSIDNFILSSAKAYEYEKGKNLNSDTASQLMIIEETFSEIKLRYAKNKYESESCSPKEEGEALDVMTGCLTKGYCIGKWKVLKTAFDIAISTEQLKLEESK